MYKVTGGLEEVMKEQASWRKDPLRARHCGKRKNLLGTKSRNDVLGRGNMCKCGEP